MLTDRGDIVLSITLQRGQDPITGQIQHASGRVEAFSGWLELSTILEQAGNPAVVEFRSMEPSVYEAAGGSDAMLALARAWHERCLEDPVVSHAFSHPGQHPQHVERLAAYWEEALGGPTTYTSGLGDHSSVLRLHSGHGEHAEMDQRAQRCFALALDDAGIPDEPALRSALRDWFQQMTDAMAAFPDSADDVPGELPLPVWGWRGSAST